MIEAATTRYTREIEANANEIAEMHARLHHCFSLREQGDDARREWQQAAEQFRARYEQLAFPGGADNAVQRIREGDMEAMEAAVCFLEVRHYFFRSGYMWKDFLRVCRKARLSEKQRTRFEQVEERYKVWRKRKQQNLANNQGGSPTGLEVLLVSRLQRLAS